MMADNLKSKTIKGTGWSAVDALLGQGVSFLVGLILARLLTPSEYGLIGITMIFVVVLNGIVDSGFSSALIRKKEATDVDYNTMFFSNLGFSILLYAILAVCAPYIAIFFERQELTNLVRVMGSLLIINALSLTQVTILSKRLDFKTKTKASFVSSIISGIVGIVMAYSGFAVWSLVAQQLSRQGLYTVMLWFLNRWLPSLNFSKQSFSYLWGFGWKLLASGLLSNIWNQLYQVVVGKFYNPATLGQYTRSRDFARIFSENFTTIIQRVSYPALASIQDDKIRMVAAYRKLIKVTMFVTVISMFWLGAVAEPLLYCLIGPQWKDAASFLPFICVSMSLYPLHSINLNMLQVQGRSDIFLILEIVKKVIAIGPLCAGIFFSIKWMLVGSIITGIIAFFLNSYYTGKALHYSSFMQLKDIVPSYLLATIIGCAVYFLKFLTISNYAIFALQIIVAASVFFIISEMLQLPEYKEITQLVKSAIVKIK